MTKVRVNFTIGDDIFMEEPRNFIDFIYDEFRWEYLPTEATKHNIEKGTGSYYNEISENKLSKFPLFIFEL